jgi:acyl-CoA thioesterase-1
MAGCVLGWAVFAGKAFKSTATVLTLIAATAVSTPALAAAAAPTPVRAAATPPSILVLGDSLSAEYGLPRDSGWVNLLRQRLQQKRIDYSVANGSISGDTTRDGLTRLPQLLTRTRPAIVIVELGGNDALRGMPLASTSDNLRAIIGQARAEGAKVLLIGMQIPPNYGPDYARQFQALYGTLAQQYHTALVPFLLAGMADKPELFQADQIHPTAQAQPMLLDNVWPALQPLLR